MPSERQQDGWIGEMGEGSGGRGVEWSEGEPGGTRAAKLCKQ